jgi:predicted RNA methylase
MRLLRFIRIPSMEPFELYQRAAVTWRTRVALVGLACLLFDCRKGVDANHFYSDRLGALLEVGPEVFTPAEAETTLLPYMEEHSSLFRGARVLEIGTGSGIISLYAAKLGATSVVATDISAAAIASATNNKTALGFSATIEPRLVPGSDMSAYSVIKDDEKFDIIISNPPYSLDLDAATDNALVDSGDLGFSIIKGLTKHLRPGGKAILLYRSLFYQEIIVRYARALGLQVKYDHGDLLTAWELQALFNGYLERIAKRQPEIRDKKFDWKQEDWARLQITVRDRVDGKKYPGVITIESAR